MIYPHVYVHSITCAFIVYVCLYAGRLVHGIMANWADEEEAPRGRTRLHSGTACIC